MMPRSEEEREFAEEAASLWRIALPPSVWAVHFVVCYASAALWCAKLDAAELGALRIWIGLCTVVALVIIGWLAWRAWRQWDFLDDRDHEHGGAHAEDRHEFLGHAAFLLAILSVVGVIYVALPAIFAASCT
jgi:hypothetical protein